MTFRRSAFATRTIIFVVLIGALAAVRTPFLANVLIGEEGDFAFLVANPTPSHSLTQERTPQALIANVDGKLLFANFQHAITPYYVLEMGLGTLTRPLHLLELDFQNRTRALRASFLLLFMIGVTGLVYLSTRTLTEPHAGIWNAAIAAIPIYVLTTPLAFGASIQPQVDGSAGVLLLGLAGYLLLSADDGPSGAYRFGFAGLLVGLGRTEWVLALLTVIAITTALGAFCRVSTFRATVPMLIGLVLGIANSIFLSFDEYLLSLKIMGRVANTSDPVFVARMYLIYTAPLITLLVLGTLLSLYRLKWLLTARIGVVISLGTGGAIFLGFTLSGYPADGFPRFFAPALILITYPVMTLLLEAPIRRRYLWAGLSALGLLFGITSNAVYLINRYRGDISISSWAGRNCAEQMKSYQRSAEILAGNNSIALESVSFWLYYPNVNFLSRDLGKEGINVIKNADPQLAMRLREP